MPRPLAQARPASAWELHYQRLRHRKLRPARTATRIYRNLLARSLYSDCHMVPHDSKAFNQRLARCDAAVAVVTSFARLMLEVAATPAYITPIVLRGQVRWLDPVTSCGP